MLISLKVLLLFTLLPGVASARDLHITLNKNSDGQRIIKSRTYGEVPETGFKNTELIFPGVASSKLNDKLCNQFLVPNIIKTVLFPQSLSPACKIRAHNMSAFQCPGGPLAITVITEGVSCEETIELFKTSKIHLVGSVIPESGSDILNVNFFLE